MGAGGGFDCGIGALTFFAVEHLAWCRFAGLKLGAFKGLCDFYSGRRNFAGAEVAVAWDLIGIYRGGVAGCGGSADEACHRGHFTDGDFADYGDRRVFGAVECAGVDSGHVFGEGGCAAGPPSGGLGDSGWVPLGCREYDDDFCDSRCGVEHRISFVEFE